MSSKHTEWYIKQSEETVPIEWLILAPHFELLSFPEFAEATKEQEEPLSDEENARLAAMWQTIEDCKPSGLHMMVHPLHSAKRCHFCRQLFVNGTDHAELHAHLKTHGISCPPEAREFTEADPFTIVAYGDSNTFGYIPGNTGARYLRNIRWTGVCNAELDAFGVPYLKIDEGVNGRTVDLDDPDQSYRNGAAALDGVLNSHRPMDAFVVMLGGNDLKPYFNRTPQQIAQSMKRLLNQVRRARCGRDWGCPAILCIGPPAFTNENRPAFKGAIEASTQLAGEYEKVCVEMGVDYLAAHDAGVRSSEVDGVHLDPDSHAALGKAVAGWIKAKMTLLSKRAV